MYLCTRIDMTDRATRATVTIGSLEVDGFMLPDGSYRLSQTQAAECVGLTERNAREFLESNAFKRLMGQGYTPAILESAMPLCPLCLCGKVSPKLHLKR